MSHEYGRKQEVLPHIQQKSVSLHSVFDLIRKKKQELSKKLIPIDDAQINLPKITMIRELTMLQQPNQEDNTPRQREITEKRLDKVPHTPAKVATFSQEKINAGKDISHLELYSNQKNQQAITKKHKNIFSHDKRVKTEAADISRKATNTTQMESHRNRQSLEADFNRIQQAKEKFLNAVQVIPKAMKMRNESNLLEVVESLEVFNPFANRNNRVVNICLLKIGRPLILTSSMLYKIGEELNCFYIILMGKVKLVNGGLRKICQTGETVLEQVIFSDKQKKIALEKAKTVGKTVLLEITMEGLKKLKEELIKFGYKLGYQEMQSIIKRNYIVKNWLRNKIRLQENR